MRRRLFAALLLFVLLGPAGLSAACLSGVCPMESPAPPSAVREATTAHSGGHCDAPAQGAVAAMPGPQELWEDCCGPTVDEPVTARLADHSSPGPVGLEPAGDVTPGGSVRAVAEAATVDAPPGGAPPLFTLHAALLI